MKKPIEVTFENFKEEVLESTMPVLVDFWAPWCQPCIMMGPVLDTIADQMGDRVMVAKFNVDEETSHEIASEYGIQSIPNMKLFKNGVVVANFIGYRPQEVLIEELREALEK
jgi:thioredoxin 1